MKIILVNGSLRELGSTNKVLMYAKEQLKKEGIDSEIFWIGKESINGCIGCNKCKDTKRCYINDKVNEFLEKAEKVDGYIFASPVHFAAISGSLSSFMDRIFYIKKDIFANKVASSLCVLRRAGATSAIDEMNKYFLMSNMLVVGSQYWNIVYGRNKEEIESDLEGLQTIKTLCINIAWTIKSIDIAKKSGINVPKYEKIVKTNFIK